MFQRRAETTVERWKSRTGGIFMTPIQTMHYEGPTPQNYSKLPYWDVLLVLRINGFYHRWILQINQLTNDRSNHFQPDAQKVDLHDTGFPPNECALLTITMKKTPSYLPAPKKTPKTNPPTAGIFPGSPGIHTIFLGTLGAPNQTRETSRLFEPELRSR